MLFTLHLHLNLKKLIEDIAKKEAETSKLFITKENKNCAFKTVTFEKCKNELVVREKSPICTFGKI